MNEVLDTILTRRSVRDFTEKEIALDDLKALAKAAVSAPSARNLQTWQFMVVTNKEKIASLAKAIKHSLCIGGEYKFYGATALILASNDIGENPYAPEDCACALQNIFLAAHSLGIGSVWINQLRGICDEPEIRSLLTALRVPQEHGVYGVAALGYAAGTLQEVAHPEKVEYIL